MRGMLPKLQENNQWFGQNYDPARGWASDNRRPLSDLGSLASALEQPRGQNSPVSVDAVPSIFGRILLFEEALVDENHPLHKRADGAFRGFLAFLAFRGVRNWHLVPTDVDLPALANHQPGNHVLQMLQELSPGNLSPFVIFVRVFQPGQQQDNVHQAVGLRSPRTIVFPGEGAHLNRALADVPWWNPDMYCFVPPGRDDAQSQALRRWVLNLWGRLTAYLRTQDGLANPQRDSLSKIGTRLQRFAEALDFQGHAPQAQAANLNDVYAALEPIHIETIPGHDEATSLFLLTPHNARAKTKLIVIDQQFEQQVPDPNAASVLGAYTLADLLHDWRAGVLGKDTHRLSNYELGSDREWRRGEDLLLSSVSYVAQSDAFPGAITVAGANLSHDRSYLLPIRSELLRYLTPEWIRDNSEFSFLGSQLTFSLKLPLGPDPDSRPLWISRTYSASQQTKVTPPILEIWPNFQHPLWSVYFSYWDRNYDANVFKAAPFPEGDDSATELNANGQNELEVRRLAAPPEFYVCRSQKGNLELGVLIPRLDPPAQVGNSSCEIGVDLGTVNTHVFIKFGDENPRPLELNEATHPITAQNVPIRLHSLYGFFIPPEPSADAGVDEHAPFLTALRLRPLAANQQQTVDIAAVLKGHVFFSRQQHNAAGLDQLSVVTDLKWHATQEIYLKAYLTQALLHAIAFAFCKGASVYKIRYSVPTAFPAAQLGVVIGAMSTATNAVKNLLPQIKNNITLADFVTPVTESDAAARYFAAAPPGPQQALLNQGAVIVDIGGGTSDISVWRQGQPAWQTSLKLAGREIFQEPLYRLRDSLRPLLLDPVVQEYFPHGPRSYFGTNNESEFAKKLNAVIRERGEALLSRFNLNADNREIRRLKTAMAVGLGGLFYYIGIVLRFLAERPEGPVVVVDEIRSIHIGGNGSQLVYWITPGGREGYQESGVVAQFLTRMLVAGSQKANGAPPLDMGKGFGFQVRLTTQPKAEVAYGLLVPDQAATAAADNELAAKANAGPDFFNEVVAGEPFSVGGAGHSPTQMLTTNLLGEEIAVTALPELTHFIESYKRDSVVSGLGHLYDSVPAGIAPQVVSQVNDWLTSQRRTPQVSRELTPLFIVGLRRLLAHLVV